MPVDCTTQTISVWCAVNKIFSCMINGDHMYIFLIMCPDILLAKHIILNLFLFVLLVVSAAHAK